MDQSSVSQNRKSRRSPVLLTASIEVEGANIPVKLRNLSEEGALIESESLPPEGSSTLFQRKELRVRGQVVWVHGNYAGIAFAMPLKPDDLLRHVPEPKQKPAGDFRRPGFACRPLAPHERRLLETWLATSQLGMIGD